MNKQTIIVIIASLVILVSFAYSAWNIFSSDKIQFKAENQDFSYFELMNSKKIAICNTLPLPVDLNTIKISMIFEGRNLGMLEFSKLHLEPNLETEIQGHFTSETYEEAQYMSLHFDSMYNNVIPNRIDQSKMHITTDIQTKIIGVIPYSVINQYSGLEFWKMMEDNKKSGC